MPTISNQIDGKINHKLEENNGKYTLKYNRQQKHFNFLI